MDGIEALMVACSVPAELRASVIANARKLYESRQQLGLLLRYVHSVRATPVTILHTERREGDVSHMS